MTYPTLQKIKAENLQQELAELQDKIFDLERFQNFIGVNDLLDESRKIIVDNDKDIERIRINIKKIVNEIYLLQEPVQKKIRQLKFLMALIEKYFDQSQVNSINSVFAKHRNMLQEMLETNPIETESINARINAIDHLFASELIKIPKAMVAYLQDKNFIYNYENYKTEIIEIIENNDINTKQINNNENLASIEFLETSIAEFEISYQNFQARLAWITCYDKIFQNEKLIVSDEIDKAKFEVQGLINDLNSFNPREKSFAILDNELGLLSQRLNDLHQLNHVALQKQQCNLIELIKISKDKLTKHVEKKLSQSTSKCAASKRDQINGISTKINALINCEINPDDDAFHSQMSDNISELKQTINAAKVILSEYRGISLLRCFATFFGGGKVTSQLLVQNLEQQLTDLQNNVNGQALSL